MMATTTTDGTFSFPGLAYGTYQVFAEVAGKSTDPHTVILDEINPSTSGIKMVILENSIVFLGIANSEIFKTDLLVYPNPAADMLNVKIDLKKPAKINIEILDPVGRILSGVQHQTYGQTNIAVDVSLLPEGVYYIRCEALGDVIMKMFVKQ